MGKVGVVEGSCLGFGVAGMDDLLTQKHTISVNPWQQTATVGLHQGIKAPAPLNLNDQTMGAELNDTYRKYVLFFFPHWTVHMHKYNKFM